MYIKKRYVFVISLSFKDRVESGIRQKLRFELGYHKYDPLMLKE
jgi:hypothetical protein